MEDLLLTTFKNTLKSHRFDSVRYKIVVDSSARQKGGIKRG